MTLTNLSKKFHLSYILFHKYIYTARFYKKDLFLKTSQYSQEKTSLSRSIITFIYYKTVCPFNIFHSHKAMSMTVSKTIRSSRTEVFSKKGVCRNFSKFTRKHLCQRLFFNKVAGLRPVKKETLAQAFSCEFCKISKNTFFHRTSLVAASGLQLF